MKHYTLVILTLIFLAACGGGSVASIEDRVRTTAFIGGTPRGVAVFTEQGVTVSPAILDAIDTGLARTFAKSQCRYARSLSYGNYQFTLIRGEIYNGNPVYRLPCNQYCGTEYDKGGYIFAAGQVIEFVPIDSGRRNNIVIPEQFANTANAETISEYEAEHVELAHWDGDKFDETKTHGNGAGHPIWNCP